MYYFIFEIFCMENFLSWLFNHLIMIPQAYFPCLLIFMRLIRKFTEKHFKLQHIMNIDTQTKLLKFSRSKKLLKIMIIRLINTNIMWKPLLRELSKRTWMIWWIKSKMIRKTLSNIKILNWINSLQRSKQYLCLTSLFIPNCNNVTKIKFYTE